MRTEGRGRALDEAPSDLEEQQPDRELNTANERAGEGASEVVDQSGPAENDEDGSDHERRSRDLVSAQALRDRDGSARLQRLDSDRQPIHKRDDDVQETRR